MNEKMCGTGEMTYILGHRYIGKWKNNMKNGFGSLLYVTGGVYSGQFKNDKRKYMKFYSFLYLNYNACVFKWISLQTICDEGHFHGTLRCNNGDVFEGYRIIYIYS